MISTRQARIMATVCLISLWGGLLTATLALSAPQQKPPAKRPPARPTAKLNPTLIAQGKKIYEKNGCATCHVIDGKGGNIGPDLTATGAVPTHTVAWLAAHVANPKVHTPNSTMPAYAQTIKGKDMTALATYLASLKGKPAAPAGETASGKTAVPASDPAAIAAIQKMGALIGTIAQNDDHLEVNFHVLGAAVTDKDIAPLSRLKGVTRLDLGSTSITDAALVHVKGLKELTHLHLEKTKITDAGLAQLKDLNALVYLNLYGTDVTDAGLEHLTGLSKLKNIYLWQTRVTQAGVDKLKKALPQVEVVLGWDTPSPPK